MPNEWPLIASGQAESASRIATSGTTHGELAGAQVERGVAHRRPDLAVQHGRDQPQHVHRREHDRDRADDGPAPALLEDAGQDQELAGEVRRERHRERDHADRHQHGRERRPPAGHPAEAATSSPVAVRRSTIPASRNIDIEIRPWLTICSTEPSKPRSFVGEDAERDQPHLRERRVRDDAADVGRAEGEQRAVDEPDRREREDQVAEVAASAPGNLTIAIRRKPYDGDLRDHAGEQPRRPRAATRGRRRAASRGRARAAP